MKKLLFIFSLILVFGLVLLYFVNTRSNSTYIPKKPQAICGNDKVLNENILEGKKEYNINCVMCHPIEKRTNPDVIRLGFKHYNLDTFKKYLKNKQRTRIHIYGDFVCQEFPDLNDKKIKYIYNYIAYSLN